MYLGEQDAIRMDSLVVGKKYIIERKYDNSKKPPMTIETLVEIIGKKKPGIITVKFLSGLYKNIGKIKDIAYNSYEFSNYIPPADNLECENLFLKAAILIIIWLYIGGVIKMS